MEEKKMSIRSLGEEVLSRLAKMLDNGTCGWRQLARAVADHPQLQYSESELTSCSLQVLSATGSPGRTLLSWLAERSCSLDILLLCLNRLDHQEAVEYLKTSVAKMISITVQPQSQRAPVNGRVILTCTAVGPPDLSYQWFRGKEEILDQSGTTPTLDLSPITPGHEGHYICRVSHGENFIFSQWAHIHLIQSAESSPVCSSTPFTVSGNRLRIVHQPASITVSEGKSLLLKCTAESDQAIQYEWYLNMVLLAQQQSSTLSIPCVTTEHRGQYKCKVFSVNQEVWSDTATVNIGPSSVTEENWVEVDRGPGVPGSGGVHRSTLGSEMNPLQQGTKAAFKSKQYQAKDKVALLIGNMNYLHMTQLSAPIADVHELTNLLRQMDFKVVSLLDLNCQEMQSAVTEFLMLLDKGVYGLLYFAGHGYENYGNSFMVPIDAPASFTSEHCLCVQVILTKMQEKETGLNVFLLDMCRKRNPNDHVIVEPGLLKVTANIVYGYATCVDAEAYEVKREDVANGIFINFLKQRVCEDEKVTVMLDRVAEDMGRCAITRGRQALELRSNLSERRSLTDQIKPSECLESSSARNLQWAVAHDLPASRYLHFECGVTAQLGFAAEFSNIMVIYTRILQKPEDIISCSVQLTDFAGDVDIDLKKSNQETLLEAGSLLLTEKDLLSPEIPGLYTRICSLQRLKSELTFTVCLHYTYLHMDEEILERQCVTVGKPLVSKLNLHEPRVCSPCHSLDSLNMPKCSSSFKTFTSVESDSRWSFNTQSAGAPSTSEYSTLSGKTNIPVETDCLEWCDNPKPLVVTKSLPHSRVDDVTFRFSDNFHSY